MGRGVIAVTPPPREVSGPHLLGVEMRNVSVRCWEACKGDGHHSFMVFCVLMDVQAPQMAPKIGSRTAGREEKSPPSSLCSPP